MLTSSIPAIWKTATITPIFKSGSPNEANNYRPISLTCIANTIMETIIKDNMLDHLNKSKLISRQQHGVLARHSINTQLLESYNDIAYLDFAKAFDPVVHNKLLFKLSAYEFAILLYSWFCEFLCSRYQCVKVGHCVSSECNVINGVP